jgi:hypothetical protein
MTARRSSCLAIRQRRLEMDEKEVVWFCAGGATLALLALLDYWIDKLSNGRVKFHTLRMLIIIALSISAARLGEIYLPALF